MVDVNMDTIIEAPVEDLCRHEHKTPKLCLDMKAVVGIKPAASSLRIETLSVASPLSRNTLQNTCIPRSGISTPVETPRPSLLTVSFPEIRIFSPTDCLLTPHNKRPSKIIPGCLSSSPSSKSPSSPLAASYAGVARSILKRRNARNRQQFAKVKRVAFRPALTEMIQTNTYVVPHVELFSPAADGSENTFLSVNEILAEKENKLVSPLPQQFRKQSRIDRQWEAAIARAEAEKADEEDEEEVGKDYAECVRKETLMERTVRMPSIGQTLASAGTPPPLTALMILQTGFYGSVGDGFEIGSPSPVVSCAA